MGKLLYEKFKFNLKYETSLSSDIFTINEYCKQRLILLASVKYTDLYIYCISILILNLVSSTL